jgi:Glycosyl hydrolase family 26
MSGRRRVACLACLLAGLAGLAGPRHALSHEIALGAYVPGSTWHPGLIDRYGRRVGRSPVIVSSYEPWTVQPFSRRDLNGAWHRGAIPMITWEPWSWAGGRRFPLRAIAAGRYDAYVRRAARAAVKWGRPVLLRFAHEMNGGWYPWGRGHGNTSAVYKRAWRHLVQIFRREGASNVMWVWTPNVDNSGKYPFRGLYPGDAWVDWVGLDGFNWGKQGEWTSFRQVFGRSYRVLTQISRRPVIIAETGSTQQGGDKPAWVSRALRREIPRLRRVRAVVWFDERFDGIDTRVDSSRASLRAFRSAARSSRYAMNRSQLLEISLHFKGPR